MPYMNGVQYKKQVQSKFSPDSHRDKNSSVRQARVLDYDDDDFVDPSPIWTNMQFLSETVSAMIFSSMDEIMKRFDHQKSDHGVGYKDPPVVGGSDKTEEVKTVEPNVDRKGKGNLDSSDDIVLSYTLEAPSFDLGVGSTQPDILHSEGIQKHVDSVISDVVTTITTIDTEGLKACENIAVSICAVEGKLFKHDDIVVFENYKGRVDEVDSSAFMAWFQRGYKPRTNHDCRIFVILYALYILREGKESIPHTFNASKCRIDIATLMYKYQEIYVKRSRQPITGEGIVIK
ncbi:Hypothetical predicted protein [Olea europaea subsp. europaea]|uniref:Uncharacterized protein n=1 Tax=Olea europaea subsp. europaea TaxID=158383 RepID=A0A8S0TF38_OLEEU|nr:Hypothetical predicted protein [Olea europaea subsp. europaea]